MVHENLIVMMNSILNDTSLAVLYALLSALGFALWNIFLQRALERGATPRQALVSMGWAMTIAFLPIALWLGWRGSLPPLKAEGLTLYFGAGLITAALAPFHSAQATRRIGAAQTTALRLLDPFFAFVIGVLFLGERVLWQAAGGVLLIMVALGILQLDRKDASAAPAVKRHVEGILFAVGASVLFTIGSVMRKSGLATVPSPLVSVTVEGLAGLLVMLPVVLIGRKGRTLADLFPLKLPDLWFSGFGAAAGTLFLNLALQTLPVPVAVALRNTSPWFALLLVPLILGSYHRPGRWTWVSTFLLTGGMLLIVTR